MLGDGLGPSRRRNSRVFPDVFFAKYQRAAPAFLDARKISPCQSLGDLVLRPPPRGSFALTCSKAFNSVASSCTPCKRAGSSPSPEMADSNNSRQIFTRPAQRG